MFFPDPKASTFYTVKPEAENVRNALQRAGSCFLSWLCINILSPSDVIESVDTNQVLVMTQRKSFTVPISFSFQLPLHHHTSTLVDLCGHRSKFKVIVTSQNTVLAVTQTLLHQF